MLGVVGVPFPVSSLCQKCSFKALSHQTSSHYVILNELRTGWPPANFKQVQPSGRPSPSRKFVAHPESLYEVQEVRIQFVPIWMNVVWYDGGITQKDFLYFNVREVPIFQLSSSRSESLFTSLVLYYVPSEWAPTCVTTL